MKAINLIKEVKAKSKVFPNMDVDKIIDSYPDSILTESEWDRFWNILNRETYIENYSGCRFFFN